MFEQIKKFMQSVDRNGDWENATTEEYEYILETINNWVDEGLEVTPRIENYIKWLDEKVYE